MCECSGHSLIGDMQIFLSFCSKYEAAASVPLLFMTINYALEGAAVHFLLSVHHSP